MMALLVLKSKIKNFYEKHYFPVRSALKTLCVFLVLLFDPYEYGIYAGLRQCVAVDFDRGTVRCNTGCCILSCDDCFYDAGDPSGVGDDVGDIFDRHNHLSASFFSYGKKAV